MHKDIYIKLINMPTSIRSYVIAKFDCYCIVLNSNLTYEAQRTAYKHEKFHIDNGDYDHMSDIDFIEINAHSI